jgi:hypothetical protein
MRKTTSVANQPIEQKPKKVIVTVREIKMYVGDIGIIAKVGKKQTHSVCEHLTEHLLMTMQKHINECLKATRLKEKNKAIPSTKKIPRNRMVK